MTMVGESGRIDLMLATANKQPAVSTTDCRSQLKDKENRIWLVLNQINSEVINAIQVSYIYYREVSKQVQRNDIAWKEIEAHGMSWNAMEPWTLDGNQCSCDIIPCDSNLNKEVT